MAVPIPISFTASKLPAEKPLGVQELLNLIGDSLSANFDPDTYILGQMNGILPSQNYGPWVNNSAWWFWDSRQGAYVRGADGVPVGTIVIWGGQGAPTNWLTCDGSEVLISQYQTLYHVIGTTWGAGDGSTTFNLPPGAMIYANQGNNPWPYFYQFTRGGTQSAPLLTSAQLPQLQARVSFTEVNRQQPGPYGIPILQPSNQPVNQITCEVLSSVGTPLNVQERTQISIMPPFAAANHIIKYQ